RARRRAHPRGHELPGPHRVRRAARLARPLRRGGRRARAVDRALHGRGRGDALGRFAGALAAAMMKMSGRRDLGGPMKTLRPLLLVALLALTLPTTADEPFRQAPDVPVTVDHIALDLDVDLQGRAVRGTAT